VQAKTFPKYLLLLIVSAALSTLTVVFGAAPMRVSRQVFGRLAFWVGHLLVALALMFVPDMSAYALVFLSLTVLVGVYGEVEECGSSIFVSGATALLASMGSVALAASSWFYLAKSNIIIHLSPSIQPQQLMQMIKAQMVPIAERLGSLNSQIQVDADALIQQLPSGIVILMLSALLIALVWERRFYSWFKLPRVVAISELLAFRVPDLTVWVAMLVILGAFVHHGIGWLEIVSVNFLNVFVIIYFFQGLAVVSSVFKVFRVHPLWQGFWYLLIVLQLFLLVSLVGFADYWVEFRQRFSPKPAQTNRSI
jgi:hypothetical protein